MDNKFYTTKEASEYLRTTPQTILRLVKENKLNFVGKPENYQEIISLRDKKGGRGKGARNLLFTKEMLDKYLGI